MHAPGMGSLGPGHELVSDRGLSHHFQAMWFLDDSVNKMGRNSVIFPLSRSLEFTVLFTQLPLLAALLVAGLLKKFLSKRFSKLISKSMH